MRFISIAFVTLISICVDASGQAPAREAQADLPRIAQGGQKFGVYGWLHRVTIESQGASARLRVCGGFVVSVAGSDGYHQPERGCLYFSSPSGAGAVPQDWRELATLAETGAPMTNAVGSVIKGLVGFGRPGISARVRTAGDAVPEPDPYAGGDPVALIPVSEWPQEMRRVQKPPHTLNYALVERVVIEPRSGVPDRVRIDGVFAMETSEAQETSYAAPERGYLYVSAQSQLDLGTWSSFAGSGQIVRFHLFRPAGVEIRLRRPDEPPAAPDLLATWGAVEPSAVITSSDHTPIRALHERR